VFSQSVLGSGYFPPMASFVAQYQPDLPLDRFAAGRLGLIQPGWGTTYLYVAYRYLAGPGFNADEQKVLLSLWNEKPDSQRQPEGEERVEPRASVLGFPLLDQDPIDMKGDRDGCG
jgi:hypothetical protein